MDPNYAPGTVNDEADKLITKVRSCYLGNPGGREDLIPIWKSMVLELMQTRAELRRIVEEDVLDMSFEEEVASDIKKMRPGSHYPVNEQSLEDSRENLKDFAKIMMKLADCIDQVKYRSQVPYVEFYIPIG